jgi:hypothetical protein
MLPSGTGWTRFAAAVTTTRWLTIARREADFELVELVPLRFGPLVVVNRQHFLQTAAR